MQLTRIFQRILCRSALSAAVLGGVIAFGAVPPNAPEWLEPYPPFKIAGPLYHVGSKDLAVYLITTPQGSILINSTLEENVPMIRANVEQLGFKFSDIKILLISHAHWDHCAASAQIKQLTGAEYMVMEGDADVVESGGRSDFHYSDAPSTFYPPAKVDRVLRDGDVVELGGISLVAHRTAGHTRGCTSWALKVSEAGRDYDAVIIGSPNVNEGFNLLNDPDYPNMADDYANGFRLLKSLPCDLFLGAHGSYFNMLAKHARLDSDTANPFVDPEGYKSYVARREKAFLNELAKQKQMAQSQPQHH
ncbi:MAG TPA: subclass B3 metallo-beta-lactamase [Opitutaceae bacterium]|nr:subclass B3 metallo-beta-lactamase [Opitutaceae bacterium]